MMSKKMFSQRSKGLTLEDYTNFAEIRSIQLSSIRSSHGSAMINTLLFQKRAPKAPSHPSYFETMSSVVQRILSGPAERVSISSADN
jgi:hypothetical protein